MRKMLIPFYILGESIYTLKNILTVKREGWNGISEIVANLFGVILFLFIDKIIFIEPSNNIISK